MLCPIRLGLAALMGLALAAPTIARAGQPDDCPTCAGRQPQTHAVKVHRGLFGRREVEATGVQPPHLCPDCLRKAAEQGLAIPATPPGAPAPGGCVACQMGQATPMMAGPVVGGPVVMAMGGPEPAGYAVVGGPMAAQGVVGGSTPEPTPIGVVQAGFRSTGTAPAPGREAPGYASTYGPAATSHAGFAQAQPTAIGGLTVNEHGPSHVAKTLLGFRRSRLAQAREDRRRAEHAKITYDPDVRTVSEIPASAVYGR